MTETSAPMDAKEYMAQVMIESRLAAEWCVAAGWDPNSSDFDNAVYNAELAVDILIDQSVLMPSERWEEDCHLCEQRIGDHFVDGRCPGMSGADAD